MTIFGALFFIYKQSLTQACLFLDICSKCNPLVPSITANQQDTQKTSLGTLRGIPQCWLLHRCSLCNAFLSDSFFESDKIQRILSKNLILLIWFIQRMNQISKDPQKQYMDTFWFSKVRESYSLIVQSFFVCLFLIVFHYRNSRRRLFSLKVL